MSPAWPRGHVAEALLEAEERPFQPAVRNCRHENGRSQRNPVAQHISHKAGGPIGYDMVGNQQAQCVEKTYNPYEILPN